MHPLNCNVYRRLGVACGDPYYGRFSIFSYTARIENIWADGFLETVSLPLRAAGKVCVYSTLPSLLACRIHWVCFCYLYRGDFQINNKIIYLITNKYHSFSYSGEVLGQWHLSRLFIGCQAMHCDFHFLIKRAN